MDLREFTRALRRSWALVVAMVALALIVACAYTVAQHPKYTATSTAYVSSGANSTVNDLATGADYVQSAVKSFTGIATSTYVLQGVIKQLQLSSNVHQLQQQVSASAPVDTSLVTISVTASDPTQAARIANSVTTNLATAVRELTPQTVGAAPAVLVTQIEPADAPTSPSSPNAPLNLGIAAVLGLLLGIGLAVLRQRLDTRIHGAAEAQAVVQAPVLGEILDDPRAGSRPLVAAGGNDGRRAEAFRTLRTNLEFLDYDDRSTSIVITSSVPQEGKSLSVANLAVVIAEAGHEVVVVDADLRRPQVASYFGLEGRVGLTDVLIGATSTDKALQRWGDSGPFVLPAGRIPPNPSELLQSEAMRSLIHRLEERFDVVLIDSPPLLPVSDAAILTRRTGGALLVAAVGRTKRAELRRAALALQQVDGRVLGLVLTRVPARRASGTYDYGRKQEAAPLEHAVSPESLERVGTRS